MYSCSSTWARTRALYILHDWRPTCSACNDGGDISQQVKKCCIARRLGVKHCNTCIRAMARMFCKSISSLLTLSSIGHWASGGSAFLDTRIVSPAGGGTGRVTSCCMPSLCRTGGAVGWVAPSCWTTASPSQWVAHLGPTSSFQFRITLRVTSNSIKEQH